MSHLPRDPKHPEPLTPAELRALGVSIEIMRKIAALNPHLRLGKPFPEDISAYHVKMREGSNGTA